MLYEEETAFFEEAEEKAEGQPLAVPGQ